LVYLEPGARTTVADGAVEIEVDRFSRAHDSAQSPDNAKHLVMSMQAFPVPAGKTVTIEVEMAARKLNGKFGRSPRRLYPNCDAVRAADKAPLLRGQPGYRSALDRDGDGRACE